MIFVFGRYQKSQSLGEHTVACATCQGPTEQRLTRHYRVGHLFWLPLFTYGITYDLECSRCQRHLAITIPPPNVPLVPLVHRAGALMWLGVLMTPLLFLPLLAGLQKGPSAADVNREVRKRFREQPLDEAAQRMLKDRLADFVCTPKAQSATIRGATMRVIQVKCPLLKKFSKMSRLEILAEAEATADLLFRTDEVFIDLRGLVLSGGSTHRIAGTTEWQRTTSGDAERSAVIALLALEASAASGEHAHDAGVE